MHLTHYSPVVCNHSFEKMAEEAADKVAEPEDIFGDLNNDDDD